MLFGVTISGINLETSFGGNARITLSDSSNLMFLLLKIIVSNLLVFFFISCNREENCMVELLAFKNEIAGSIKLADKPALASIGRLALDPFNRVWDNIAHISAAELSQASVFRTAWLKGCQSRLKMGRDGLTRAAIVSVLANFNLMIGR